MTDILNDANDIRDTGKNNDMQNNDNEEKAVTACRCHKVGSLSAETLIDETTAADSRETAETKTDAAAAETKHTGCECCRHKQRSEKEYRDLITRLNRIEGQIRGIKGMLDDSAYCLDILTQVSAASSALNSFSKLLLANHIKSCVAEDIREGREDKLDELIRFMPKLMK